MKSFVEIEIDGEVVDGPDGRAPGWGFPVAIGVVTALALVVVVQLVRPVGHERTSGANPAMTSTEDSRIGVVRAALAAWGRFAVSGDVADLDEFFIPGGPQYQQLDRERPSDAVASRGVPYSVAVTDAAVVRDDGQEAVVSVKATWSRPGEADQHFVWDVVLRSTSPGRWSVWTVRDVSTTGTAPTRA